MLKAKKELGQNFLHDIEAISYMVESLNIQKKDEIIEIGPGTGAVTDKIVNDTNLTSLKAIELDPRAATYLKELFAQNEKIEIVNDSILDWLTDDKVNKNTKIIGSLPYYITSPIIHKIIELKDLPKKCVLLVQKEVAQKISATEPDASYLSSYVQAFYDVAFQMTVPNTAFDPVPSVDGGVLVLSKKPNQRISHNKKKKFEGFLHKGFSNPRKMLNKSFNDQELKATNIDGTLRPQNLAVQDWIMMFDKLVG